MSPPPPVVLPAFSPLYLVQNVQKFRTIESQRLVNCSEWEVKGGSWGWGSEKTLETGSGMQCPNGVAHKSFCGKLALQSAVRVLIPPPRLLPHTLGEFFSFIERLFTIFGFFYVGIRFFILIRSQHCWIIANYVLYDEVLYKANQNLCRVGLFLCLLIFKIFIVWSLY
jgi:hypothetical protein